jgi:hypothetical protein
MSIPGVDKVAGLLQADESMQIPEIFEKVQEHTQTAFNPMLLLLELFKDHVDTTSEHYKKLTKELEVTESGIGEELAALQDSNRKWNADTRNNYVRLSVALHESRKKLSELTRRRKFEHEVGTELQKAVNVSSALIITVNTFQDQSKGHDIDATALASRIDSQTSFVSASRPRRWQYISSDHFTQIYSLVAQRDARMQYNLGIEASKDSKAMKTLSVLTILFLPGAFIATMFSTGMFDFSSKGLEVGIYFAIVVPLTGILMLGWLRWLASETTGADIEGAAGEKKSKWWPFSKKKKKTG